MNTPLQRGDICLLRIPGRKAFRHMIVVFVPPPECAGFQFQIGPIKGRMCLTMTPQRKALRSRLLYPNMEAV